MPNTVQIKGIESLLKALVKEEKRAIEWTTAKYTVGYTQKYALVVHETPRKPKKRKGGGESRGWKYLESPTRKLNNSGQLAEVVKKTILRTKKALVGLKVGALLIQRESMKIVPIDTGALRGSAFTGPFDGEKEAQAAFAKSLTIGAEGRDKKRARAKKK